METSVSAAGDLPEIQSQLLLCNGIKLLIRMISLFKTTCNSIIPIFRKYSLKMEAKYSYEIMIGFQHSTQSFAFRIIQICGSLDV
jgi:hypothetical protein